MAVAEDRESAAPDACPPCRGTGHVLSLLGGTPAQVVCPWCEGSGMQIPGHDAQAARIAAASAQ
jgi:DnaJ-class molecular chaperone